MSVLCVVVKLHGVAKLRNVVYVVCSMSSRILRFSTRTHKQLAGIDVRNLRCPFDIVACEQTSQLYVADCGRCIWLVSSNGRYIRWLSVFNLWTLSLTSACLLVTLKNTSQLIQFSADGDELRCVQLPLDMRPQHAVESPAGTFIVGHDKHVSEVDAGGKVLRQFTRSHLLSLSNAMHIAVDSCGNIFVADCRDDVRRTGCILLLDKHLSLRCVISDKLQFLKLTFPVSLCYIEQSRQLVVGFSFGKVVAFKVLC